ncbi:FixH family protein [Hymenobacter sp. BT175]|uniref:FixH family protein n=1 Tax=Hymenobacter translucens TaxID=2886507 RepID=UPI001D0DD534|nr:FixH family protein [Hymenobacter translucens]MCC2547806.1 FixH family protein [Hymenobacter translucens]
MTTSPRTIWPYAIIAAFVLFAGYIGFMVQQAMRISVDLVSPDYYQQELAYQQRMESVARTAALPAPVQVQYVPADEQLSLELPASLAGQTVQGTLRFFRPSDQKLDFSLPFAPTGQPAQQHLSTRKLRPGYWRLRLDFSAGTRQYFVEKELTIK